MKIFSSALPATAATTAMLVVFALVLGCKPPTPPERSSTGMGDAHSRTEPRSDERRRDSERDDRANNRDSRRDREDRADGEDRGREDRETSDDRGGRNSRSRRSHPSEQSTPGEFDFYLLNLSWSPEFCATHPQSPECGAHLGFIVHGLWPQNYDGTYPEHCADSPGPSNPGAYRDVMPVASLVQHEWETHGTCSGQQPDAYFVMARKAFHEVTVPQEFSSLNAGTMLPPADILGAFARSNPSFPPESIALSCGNNRLTAIEVCMSKALQPIPCQSIRTCRAQQVKITPP